MCPNTPFTGDGQSGNDCNDSNGSINPGANDICGNSVDEDCSGVDQVCQGISCERLSPGSAVPVGFGSPYNFPSNSTELLARANCNNTQVNMSLGNGSVNQHIYSGAHVWRGGAWQAVSLTGNNSLYNGWQQGSASATINMTTQELANTNYFIFYICNWNGSQWTCGCRDTSCSTPYWQLQTFSQ